MQKPEEITWLGEGDFEDECLEDYAPKGDYLADIDASHEYCTMTHHYSAHLTETNPDGTAVKDPGRVSRPIPPIDRKKFPLVQFRFGRKIKDPPNAKSKMISDCVMLAFYDRPMGSEKWNGALQVICRKARGPGRTSVWLYYNGLANPNSKTLDRRKSGPRNLLFARGLGRLRRALGHLKKSKYRERLYMSVEGCQVTIIGEASVQHPDGRLFRSTKIHKINCCHTPDEHKA